MPEEIKSMLEEVGLQTASFQTSYKNGKPVSYSTNIREKGNKTVIEQLLSKGWEKGLRFKEQTNGNIFRNQYEGYIFVITLTYYVA